MDSGLGAFPVGPEQAARDRFAGRHRWIVGALVGQLFLISAYAAILTSGKPVAAVVGATALLLVFSALYVFVVGRVLMAPIGRRVRLVAALFLLSLPQFFMFGNAATSLWIFVAVAGGILFPDWLALVVALCLTGVMLAVDAAAGDPLSWELGLTLLALTAFMIGFAGNIRLNIELRKTQQQLAVAAVAAERERIGRDLHDILGHSLTAIAVKAGLARRLLDRDATAAAAEIADVERLAREALADVRATASGYRDVSLAAELAVAASVLRAAGIRPELPQAVDEVDPAVRELFGYVAREAVTNVVRHSNARTATITVGSHWVEIRDDGAHPTEPTAGRAGLGLSGLAERVTARGGSLQVGPRPEGGFVVRAEVPAAPLPAAALPLPAAFQAAPPDRLQPADRAAEQFRE